MTSKPGIFELACRYFRTHAAVFGIAVLLAAVLAIRSTNWWWFWPLMAWSLLFMIHFLVVKTLQVNSDWVAERTERTAERAFDVGHIESIRERYEETLARSKDQSRSEDKEPVGSKSKPDPKG